MMRKLIALMVVAFCGLGMCVFAFADTPAATTAASKPTGEPTGEEAQPTTKTREARPLPPHEDRRRQEADHPAGHGLPDGGPLELLVCRGRPPSKEYESIMDTQASPSDLHAALLVLGLTPGKPARTAVSPDRATRRSSCRPKGRNWPSA